MSNELIATVSKFAPILGGALGGPIGGVVGTLISSIFGGSTADPSELVKKIQADPEAGLKLKTLEYQHQQELAQISAQNYITEIDDRKNARANSPQFTSFLKVTSYMITIGFFTALFTMFCPALNLNDEEKQILAMLIGMLATKWGTIIDFFYGSSHTNEGFKK